MLYNSEIFSSSEYNQIQDQAGDSLYLRALVDREATSEEELSFRKDAILYIDDTLYNGMLGVWRAWLLDDEGKKVRCGTMPSKARLEKWVELSINAWKYIQHFVKKNYEHLFSRSSIN